MRDREETKLSELWKERLNWEKKVDDCLANDIKWRSTELHETSAPFRTAYIDPSAIDEEKHTQYSAIYQPPSTALARWDRAQVARASEDYTRVMTGIDPSLRRTRDTESRIDFATKMLADFEADDDFEVLRERMNGTETLKRLKQSRAVSAGGFRRQRSPQSQSQGRQFRPHQFRLPRSSTYLTSPIDPHTKSLRSVSPALPRPHSTEPQMRHVRCSSCNHDRVEELDASRRRGAESCNNVPLKRMCTTPDVRKRVATIRAYKNEIHRLEQERSYIRPSSYSANKLTKRIPQTRPKSCDVLRPRDQLASAFIEKQNRILSLHAGSPYRELDGYVAPASVECLLENDLSKKCSSTRKASPPVYSPQPECPSYKRSAEFAQRLGDQSWYKGFLEDLRVFREAELEEEEKLQRWRNCVDAKPGDSTPTPDASTVQRSLAFAARLEAMLGSRGNIASTVSGDPGQSKDGNGAEQTTVSEVQNSAPEAEAATARTEHPCTARTEHPCTGRPGTARADRPDSARSDGPATARTGRPGTARTERSGTEIGGRLDSARSERDIPEPVRTARSDGVHSARTLKQSRSGEHRTSVDLPFGCTKSQARDCRQPPRDAQGCYSDGEGQEHGSGSARHKRQSGVRLKSRSLEDLSCDPMVAAFNTETLRSDSTKGFISCNEKHLRDQKLLMEWASQIQTEPGQDSQPESLRILQEREKRRRDRSRLEHLRFLKARETLQLLQHCVRTQGSHQSLNYSRLARAQKSSQMNKKVDKSVPPTPSSLSSSRADAYHRRSPSLHVKGRQSRSTLVSPGARVSRLGSKVTAVVDTGKTRPPPRFGNSGSCTSSFHDGSYLVWVDQ